MNIVPFAHWLISIPAKSIHLKKNNWTGIFVFDLSWELVKSRYFITMMLKFNMKFPYSYKLILLNDWHCGLMHEAWLQTELIDVCSPYTPFLCRLGPEFWVILMNCTGQGSSYLLYIAWVARALLNAIQQIMHTNPLLQYASTSSTVRWM